MAHKRIKNKTPWIERAKYEVANSEERTEQLAKEVAQIRKKKEEQKDE